MKSSQLVLYEDYNPVLRLSVANGWAQFRAASFDVTTQFQNRAIFPSSSLL